LNFTRTRKKETKQKPYTIASVLSNSLYPKGVAGFVEPRPFSSKQNAEKHYEHNQQNSLSFQMVVPRPARSFFLNSRISLVQNLAFRLPAMMNGLLLSVKADF